MIRLLLSLLLFVAISSPSFAGVTVFVVCDDCSRFSVGAYRTAGDDTVTAGVGTPDTPNLDAMAAAGTRMVFMHATPLCSPTRAELITGAFVNRRANLHGHVQSDPDGYSMEIKVGSPNIFNMMQIADVQTSLFGKWHLGNTQPRDEFGGLTMLKAMGIGYSDAVVQRQTKWPDPMTDEWYTAATGFEPDCMGHRSTVRTDQDGVAYITSEHSTKVEVDTTIAYIAAWKIENPGADLFVWLALSAPHSPTRDGTGSESCVGDDPADDRPPSPFHEGTGADEVYYDMIAYIDQRMGDLRTALDLVNEDRLIFVGDNGVPSNRTLPPEVDLSIGAKGTVYTLGVFVPALFEGHDIEVGVISSMHANPDLSATLSDLMGARQPHRDGVSFAACLREEHGLTAGTCPGRDHLTGSRWQPLAGTSGTMDHRPIPSDSIFEWDSIEEWDYTTVPDGTLRLLVRVRDPGDVTMRYEEQLWEVPISGVNMYLPDATYSPIASNLFREGDLEEDDFVSPATDDELTALSGAEFQLDRLLANFGDGRPSRTGMSR